jgi:hypothetical protein
MRHNQGIQFPAYLRKTRQIPKAMMALIPPCSKLGIISRLNVCFPGSLCYIACISFCGRVTRFMAIYNLDGLLDKYNGEFLILEFNHLFISSSIREEVWLLQRKNDSPLIDKIMQAAREFDIHEVSDDRDFETYSGGQKAILACLLTLSLIGDRKINGLKLLLNNILDSISEENRSKLIRKFKEICSTRDIKLFTEKNGHIQEII